MWIRDRAQSPREVKHTNSWLLRGPWDDLRLRRDDSVDPERGGYNPRRQLGLKHTSAPGALEKQTVESLIVSQAQAVVTWLCGFAR